MYQYLNTMKDILVNGDVKTDRTGTGTTSKFGGMMKFSLQNGHWPIPTTRKIAWKKIAEELEWMLKGIVSVEWLHDRDNKIWSSWAGRNGTIGPMYGEQWRNYSAGVSKLTEEDEARLLRLVRDNSYGIHPDDGYVLNAPLAIDAFKKFLAEKTKPFEQGGRGGTDQLAYVVDQLKNNPDSRRIVVNVWHAGLLPDLKKSPGQNADDGKMALAPCHSMWQVNTAPLSKIEILRQIVRDDDKLRTEVSLYSGRVNGSEIPTASFNAYLINKGYILSNVEQYDLGVDSDFDIGAAGEPMIQQYIDSDRPVRKLSLACYARSQDVPLGTVFNVGMYSLLTHLLASQCNMLPWEYTHFMGDYHIYHNQKEAVKEQLTRKPMAPCRVIVDPTLERVEDFNADNLQVFYESHPAIKFPLAAV
jgi:thymidylate synthase